MLLAIYVQFMSLLNRMSLLYSGSYLIQTSQCEGKPLY